VDDRSDEQACEIAKGSETANRGPDMCAACATGNHRQCAAIPLSYGAPGQACGCAECALRFRPLPKDTPDFLRYPGTGFAPGADAAAAPTRR